MIFSATATGADRLRGSERVEPQQPHAANRKMRKASGSPLRPALVSALAHEEHHGG